MKKLCSFLVVLFLFSINAFGETDIEKIISEIKKDFEVVESKENFKIDNNLEKGTYTTYNFVQNNNLKVLTMGYYENNAENYEKYYLKDDKVTYIYTEKVNYSFDNKNTIKIEKEVHKYYFDNQQKLIRYIGPDNKTYDEEKIPNDAFAKGESLKKNIKSHKKLSNSKELMSEEMRAEFEEVNKEMTRRFEEMKKEMDNFFKKF